MSEINKTKNVDKKDSKKNKDQKSKDQKTKNTKNPKNPKDTKDTKRNTDELCMEDLNVVIDAELESQTLAGHHKKSFDQFTSTGINQIVTQLFRAEGVIINERDKTAEDNEIATIEFSVQFTDVRIDRPTTVSYKSGKRNLLTPNLARLHNRNYSAPIYVSAIVTAKAFLHKSLEPRVRTEEIIDFRIASMPIMVRSKKCHTYDYSTEALIQSEEDPRDIGGYFIIKGGEWAISNIESRLFNSPHVFRNVGHEKEITRLEFISKPGDAFENSRELIFRYLTTGNIFVKCTSNKYLSLLDIPFFVLFRLFGMTSDKEIIDNIVYGYRTKSGAPDVVSTHMMQILRKAFKTTDPVFGGAMYMTDQGELLRYFAKQTSILYTSGAITSNQKLDEYQVNYLNTNILKLLDKNVLPHIGLAADSRHHKLRYLGHLIHKMLLVEMQIESSTDRDSLKNKRINSAGRAYAKSFKTQFNIAIVMPMRKKLMKDFKSMPFSQVPLAQSVKSAVRGPDLERALIQAIVTGNKEITVSNRQVPNRLASELVNRKNQTNVMSTLRVIRTPNTSASKQDKRADEMRRVHPSYTGYICPIQSADTGEQVGMVKQMALGSSISDASSSELLKDILRRDKLVIPLERCLPIDIHKRNLTKILVNGDWIGCCENSPLLVYKYRELRRGYDFHKIDRTTNSEIDRLTTIYWNTYANEVTFWVDGGRMLRPILVVRNNAELDPVGQKLIGSKYDPVKDFGFIQDICLSYEDVVDLKQKKLTIELLHERGIIDYISPEEMENCYIASSLDQLKSESNNSLRRYTHCEIPVALLGLPALTCPYLDHNPPARITFQTNQVKQTCGWYTLSWPHRIDKNTFLQYYCEMPLVRTIANNYVYPNGLNAVVAIACFGGYNQEDSISINKAACDRGIYEGIHFNFIKSELENGERFGAPDEAHTIDIKKHANYGLLEEGFVRRGTIVKRDDVVIGKYYKMPKPVENGLYRDMSVVYPYDEEAMVEATVIAKNEDDKEFAKVKVSSVRPLAIGSKFSSRAGQKGMTGEEYIQSDFPFTESGIQPDLIINSHAIPSRMTIGQMLEGLVSKLAAMKGVIGDSTVFSRMDIHSIGDALEELGYDAYGRERMYNGMTGEWMDVDIFITPCYYQRLQKFAVEDLYSISTGPTCAITRQPLTGKGNKGGLRIGEMERDVIVSHGAGHFIMEKFRDDSDGFDIYVCRNCGKRPAVNEKEGVVICKICRGNARVEKVASTWASKLFFQELESMNVGVRLVLKPFKYEEYL